MKNSFTIIRMPTLENLLGIPSTLEAKIITATQDIKTEPVVDWLKGQKEVEFPEDNVTTIPRGTSLEIQFTRFLEGEILPSVKNNVIFTASAAVHTVEKHAVIKKLR